uniref:cation diffusion facilitator family transporter n=1 Tax=uncultured Bilophila sp. TaxID=529385 RepID=UPI00261F8703
MASDIPHSDANAEKNHAALSSLCWALFLTVIKLVAGLATNSLGILSEALHSSLDLVAAGITFFAVRVAARPADKTHPYGYGKIENLSALAETVLLLVTCGWIVHEAVNRLFFNAPEISPSWWGVGIILVSLLVDVNRAAMLRRVARKHKSQALEADALHFTTDIWSSGVVLAGLLCVQLSEFLPPASPFRPILHMADALAALAVSGIVVVKDNQEIADKIH